jgi:hypothetical protein
MFRCLSEYLNIGVLSEYLNIGVLSEYLNIGGHQCSGVARSASPDRIDKKCPKDTTTRLIVPYTDVTEGRGCCAMI